MTGLAGRYDAVVCDLDGVVYRGPDPVPFAVEALSALSVPVVYATNNASRPPAAVAAHLRGLGLACTPDDVVTSSQAAAWLLREDLAEGERVLVVGGVGVAEAVREAGFEPVAPSDVASGPPPAAVVQGYGPGVTAADLAEAAYAAASGARWVATNTDATLPTHRGVAPGNGSLVGAVARAVGRSPDVVAGKPEAPLYLLAAERLGVDPARVLAVGDRLDTDIEGARRAGSDSLLVLTGVDDVDALVGAPVERRPTFVAPDLRWLHLDPSGEASVDASTRALEALRSGRPDAADAVRSLLARMAGR